MTRKQTSGRERCGETLRVMPKPHLSDHLVRHITDHRRSVITFSAQHARAADELQTDTGPASQRGDSTARDFLPVRQGPSQIGARQLYGRLTKRGSASAK